MQMYEEDERARDASIILWFGYAMSEQPVISEQKKLRYDAILSASLGFV